MLFILVGVDIVIRKILVNLEVLFIWLLLKCLV